MIDSFIVNGVVRNSSEMMRTVGRVLQDATVTGDTTEIETIKAKLVATNNPVCDSIVDLIDGFLQPVTQSPS